MVWTVWQLRTATWATPLR